MGSLAEYYNYLFVELGDPRVIDWPLMRDPLNITIICALYLLAVYKLLPEFMQNRPAYDLKRIIQCYNVFQVVYCSYLAYGLATSGWTTYYTLGCQMVDYSGNPLSLRMAEFIWLTHTLKIIDFVEAGFFILRRKFNQVSPLHVYHHITMVYSSWFVAKYYPGGMASFYPMLNHCVHVVMYAYYFLSTLGPDMQKRMAKHKPKITIMQMIQFTIMLVHAAQALPSSCEIPVAVTCSLSTNVIVIFYMFYQFFVENYLRKGAAPKTTKIH